jgi:hypothetical protein
MVLRKHAKRCAEELVGGESKRGESGVVGAGNM